MCQTENGAGLIPARRARGNHICAFPQPPTNDSKGDGSREKTGDIRRLGRGADLLTFARMVQLHPVVPILAGRCRAHGRKRLGYRNALNEAPQTARCNCGCDGQPRGSILRQAARHGPPLRRLGRAQADFPALVVQIRPAAPPVCVLGILGIPPSCMA